MFDCCAAAFLTPDLLPAAHEAALAAASAEGAWLPLLSMKNAAGALTSWDRNAATLQRSGATCPPVSGVAVPRTQTCKVASARSSNGQS